MFVFVGAIPAECLQWCRISQGQVNGCVTPITFQATATTTSGIVQGALRNGWLTSAMAIIATNQTLLRQTLVITFTHSYTQNAHKFKFTHSNVLG